MGNTWCVFRLKPAGPAPSMGSPTAESPERSLCAPGAHTGVLTPCLPPTHAARPLLWRLDRASETHGEHSWPLALVPTRWSLMDSAHTPLPLRGEDVETWDG